MRKNKTIILLVIAALLLAAVIFLFFKKEKTAEIGSQKFRLELASASSEREKGLGGRQNLCSGCAMLFVFPEKGIYSFWMKNMEFDLDIIWVSDNKIVYIAKNVSHESLETINPPEEADKALEINAGLVDKYKFQIGDQVNFSQL